MEELVVLGTGNGSALNCYNTCFALKNGEEYFVVDGGGGNKILNNLRDLKIELSSIHHIFISHNHIDHILGVMWLVRLIGLLIARNGRYNGNLNIYASNETMTAISTMVKLLAPNDVKKVWGKQILLHTVSDREELDILGCKTIFVDIQAQKEKQFGFKLEISAGKWLAFLGDEPYNEKSFEIIKDSDWLLHEAFCLETEAELFKPYEKGRCTVKEASLVAEKLKVKNLILWHTMDNNLLNRRQVYTNEASLYFTGNTIVPDDLDIIKL